MELLLLSPRIENTREILSRVFLHLCSASFVRSIIPLFPCLPGSFRYRSWKLCLSLSQGLLTDSAQGSFNPCFLFVRFCQPKSTEKFETRLPRLPWWLAGLWWLSKWRDKRWGLFLPESSKNSWRAWGKNTRRRARRRRAGGVEGVGKIPLRRFHWLGVVTRSS